MVRNLPNCRLPFAFRAREKIENRVNRSVKYLTKDLPAKWRIKKSRIVVIYGGKTDILAMTLLQPVEKGMKPPNYKLNDKKFD